MMETEQIKTNYKDIKVLSKNDIIQRLKNMVVDGENVLPLKWFSFIVINPNYNPEEFSQAIEESEVMIDFWKEFTEEIHKPEFDFVWNNTLSKLPRNSEEWNKNHSKICPVKAAYFEFMAACVQHNNGIRNYYSDDILDKVIKVSEEYGGIVDFV